MVEQHLCKINVWNLTEYEQVAYLDTDIFLPGGQSNGIFDDCIEDVCAIEANQQENLPSDGSYPSPWFNGGVLVVRPSAKRFQYLIGDRLKKGYKLPRFNEEA